MHHPLPSRENAGPAGPARGVRHEGPGEHCALRRQGVEVGCLHDGSSGLGVEEVGVAAQVGAELVGD